MIGRYFKKTNHAAPLAIFRIVTGCMLFLGILRFCSKGWINELYIQPKFFFSFYGFEFVKPIGEYTYLIYACCGIAALFVAAGWYYRQAIVILFLSFTYIELMDKTAYLNHYYFISVVLLLLCFLPAQRYFSVDAYRNPEIQRTYLPKWTVDVLKVMVVMLYFYAGLAKLNSDWLLHALPLKIWLPARNDMPIIGWLFDYPETAYIFSWIGCLYDLTIGFLLWNRKTRWFAFISVALFHGMTALLFPIGMFPYIMIVTALLFFSPAFHLQIIAFLNRLFKLPKASLYNENTLAYSFYQKRLFLAFFSIFFTVQLLMPFRYMLYADELFWTEQGYRFSWRVMLIEKAGFAEFTVKDSGGKAVLVNNDEFLTPLQEKMMSTQPDFIIQYAHLLRDVYAQRGFKNPEVYAEVYVTLNGRLSQRFIDPKVDLAKEKDTFAPKSWIIPLNDEIKGF